MPPFSCIFAPHSAIFSTPAAIACGIRVGSSFILFMIVVTSLPAAVKILGSPVISPVTMAAIICGMAAIKSGIASMMPSINATIISPALSIISGMPSTSAFMIAVMISGSASISTGSAATSPCASPVSSCNAAVISNGIFSISMVTMFVTTVTIVGSNVGKAASVSFTFFACSSYVFCSTACFAFSASTLLALSLYSAVTSFISELSTLRVLLISLQAALYSASPSKLNLVLTFCVLSAIIKSPLTLCLYRPCFL